MPERNQPLTHDARPEIGQKNAGKAPKEERFTAIDICQRAYTYGEKQTWYDGQRSPETAQLCEATLDLWYFTVPLIDETPRGRTNDGGIMSVIIFSADGQFQDANFRGSSHVATQISDKIDEAAKQNRPKKEVPLDIMFPLEAAAMSTGGCYIGRVRV
ncbi:MAG: hypothetical protein Q9166_004148 [cf. Caloplaca sp. 2 TL-2023]